MRRIDRVVDLASRIAVARAEATRLEGELERLVGGGKEPAAEAEPVASPPPTPATNGNGHRRHGPEASALHGQVIDLARAGLKPQEIADRLGLEGRPGLVKVHQHMYRARNAGHLPKAGAST